MSKLGAVKSAIGSNPCFIFKGDKFEVCVWGGEGEEKEDGEGGEGRGREGKGGEGRGREGRGDV